MHELMIVLDNHSKTPLYEQIYDYIRKNITDGKISCGEKLPSTRFLAAHLQVARSTVESAYAQLLSEGYLESKPCLGYYASDISDLYLNKTAIEEKRKEAQKVFLRPPEKKKYRLVFSPDENEFSCFPYAAWRKISRDILSQDDASLLTAGEAAGEWDLRETISRYLYQARGVNCHPGQIIVGAGNEYLLLLLAQVLGAGKRVAIENPTYLKAYQTLSNMGYQMLPLPAFKNGMQIEELQYTNAEIVYTMPSHQFPMGTVMPMKMRLGLLQWASRASGRYIIEDDHDSEFRYRGKPIPSLQGIDHNGTVIYIGTFSKSISPAIRVSYMVLPKALLSVYCRRCGFYASTVPKEQQKVLAAFLNGGYFERYLNKMRRIYKGKHDSFLALLKQESWVKKISGDHAGMHLLVEVKSDKNAGEIVKEAKKGGVRVYALEEYFIFEYRDEGFLPELKNTLLLGYGSLTEAEMKEGIACLREIIN